MITERGQNFWEGGGNPEEGAEYFQGKGIRGRAFRGRILSFH